MMRTLIAFAFAATLPLTVQAAERPQLRAEVTTADPIVTIGDFFRNPGPFADRPLFRAPDLGLTGSVPASDVMRRAQEAGLANADGAGLREVIVHRTALEIEPQRLEDMIRDALLERIGNDDPAALEIRYSQPLPRLIADPRAANPLVLDRLSHSSRTGRFDAVFSVRLEQRAMTVAVAGTARETVAVAILTRRVARGETVTLRDFDTLRVPRHRLQPGAVLDPADIVGLAARRAQAAGRPLLARDFQEPIVVKRREKVIMTFRTAGLTLTVQGEAMADGTEGDVIDVLNIQSRRVVQATVTGPGRVVVTARAARFAGLQETSQ